MGAISSVEQTHVKRSSSMSFAMRWIHENLRMISKIAILSCAFIFMFLMLLYGTATKRVSIVVNGQEKVVETRKAVLQQILDEQAVSISPHDRVSASLDTTIKHGQQIVIQTTVPIQVTADGVTNTLYTTGKTVQQAVADLQISVGADDKILPDLSTEVTTDSSIRIVRVSKVTEQVKEPIAFEIVKQEDAKLLKGKEQIVQQGKEGVVIKNHVKTYEDGVLLSEDITSETVESASVNRIVAVGTKKPVTVLSATSESINELSKAGITFGVKQILNNVTLTGYSAGVESTGKKPGDRNYGMTFTGTKVTEGRTIAVDPKVIPLGWWVYIEGIGFRRAEDTGSAVKGQKIDVYYESESFANRFGLKRGYTVYIIGPKKPSEE